MAKIFVLDKKKSVEINESEVEPEFVPPKSESLPKPVAHVHEPEHDVIVEDIVEAVEPDPPPSPPVDDKRTGCRDWLACRHFPVCCKLPLVTSFQIFLIVDMVVALLVVAVWTLILRDDSFQARLGFNEVNSSNTDQGSYNQDDQITQVVDKNKNENLDDDNIFAEATTVHGVPIFPSNVDQEGLALAYSKIAFYTLKYQQEIQEGCGNEYYVEQLFDLNLNRTDTLLREIIYANYISEMIEIFIDISFFVTTCCFFSYTSAKGYLIVLWILELLPFSLKFWIAVASRSISFCIFQYGSGPGVRVLDFISFFYIIPIILFRVYKVLIFSFFIRSLFTKSGRIVHWTKVQGATLLEYRELHKEYLEMGKDKEDTSSDPD